LINNQILKIENQLQLENFNVLSKEIKVLKEQNIKLEYELKRIEKLENRNSHLGEKFKFYNLKRM
jgi:cell shape-determining protein MreC